MIQKFITLGVIILLIGVSLLLIHSMQVSEKLADTDAMNTAQALYEDGHYAETIRVYEQIVSTGVRDSDVYYNLGNAYFRDGDLGRAILNYERASEITPRDADIRHNLALARTEAGISNDRSTINPLLGFSSLSKSWMSLDEISMISLAAWMTSGLLFFIYFIFSKASLRKLTGTLIIISIIITLGTSITLAARLLSNSRAGDWIVTKPNTYLLDQPNGEAEDGFVLPAGMHARVIEQKGDWVLLTTSDRILEGWAPEDAIETLAL